MPSATRQGCSWPSTGSCGVAARPGRHEPDHLNAASRSILHSMTPTGFRATLPAPRRPDPLGVPALRWGIPGHRMDRRTIRPRAADLDDPASRRRRLPHPASAERFAAAAGALDRARVARGAGRRPRHRHRLRRDAAPGPPRERPAGNRRRQARAGGEALRPGRRPSRGGLPPAATAGVLCMEAMWTLFLPRFDVVRQVLEQGLLGDVRTVLADHGERFDPPHRILDPAMAGGSLLDLGSYLTVVGDLDAGPGPGRVRHRRDDARWRQRPGGDGPETHGRRRPQRAAHDPAHPDPTAAVIAGTAATLTLPGPFFMPGDVVLTSADGDRTADLGRARAHRPWRACTTPL